MTILLPNPGVDPGFQVSAPPPDREGAGSPLAFHRRLPGYGPTALVTVPALAAAAGVGEVWVKDESSRFGLPAFKMLGASWASYLALVDALAETVGGRGPGAPGEWRSVDELAVLVAPLRPLTLVTATDGNHGRAVARFARWLALDAHVFVPDGTARARIEAIEGEGARVDVVDGDYDAAVQTAAVLAGSRALVISDTAWPGYERVPGWVIDGYSTIFAELEEQLAARAIGAPDAVLVQVGVGALAAATVRHFRRAGRAARPRLVAVEPETAACALASARAGHLATVPGPHRSIMAGLNCGTPSTLAWPLLHAGIDVFVAIDDDRARDGMRALAAGGLVSGETGAAGAGALLELFTGAGAPAHRAELGLGPESRVLLLSTEGATDPAYYEAVVGRAAPGPSA